MNFLFLLVVATGLGMDAFSVAVGVGSVVKRPLFSHIFRLSFHFGLFQFLMPIVGWTVGITLAGVITDYDHWIAFVLLFCVGG